MRVRVRMGFYTYIRKAVNIPYSSNLYCIATATERHCFMIYIQTVKVRQLDDVLMKLWGTIIAALPVHLKGTVKKCKTFIRLQ